MDDPVEQYRASLEEEIKRWRGFWNALRKDHREAFESLMDMGRSYAMEGNNAPKSPTFQPMVLSILIAQRKQIKQLDEELKALKPPQEEKKPPAETPKPAAVYYKKKKPGGEQARLW